MDKNFLGIANEIWESILNILNLYYHYIPIEASMNCACCGSEMLPDSELENVVIYKCKECGLTNSKLKDNK